ncbi:MAG: transcriptional repressor [Oligoflexales bacterium]|nr:transcriptional repressor [Oligoflexales bacterium]
MEEQTTRDDKKLRWFWDGLNDYLSRNQMKKTKQREFIVSRFLEMGNHIDAETLYDQMRKDGYSFGLATIYRTLNLLRNAGLVNQQIFAEGRAVFELSKPNTHHDHIVCTACGKIEEFENEEIENLQEMTAKRMGFLLSYHRLDLYGVCKDCQ